MEITRSILRPVSGSVFSALAAGLAAIHLAIPAMVVADIPVPQEPDSGVVSEPAQARPIKPEIPKPGQAPEYSGDLRSLAALNIRNARLEKVITGLDRPWALEFLSSNEVIITEMPGRLSRHNLDSGAKAAIGGLPEIASDHDQSGLLDIELHPDYDNNGRIYFSYVISDEKSGRYYLTAVATAVLKGNRLEEVKQILAAGPFGWSP